MGDAGLAEGMRETMKQACGPRKASGRPRKFAGPSRVVTLTLPEETIDRLRHINRDRAKAIVMAAQMAAPAAEGTAAGTAAATVELIQVAGNAGMITVPSCACLKSIPDLKLAQIGADRCLVLLSRGTSLSDIEIALADQLETPRGQGAAERQILIQLLQHIRSYRRSKRVDKAEVILVDING